MRALLLGVILGFVGTQASAHARLVDATPAEGGTVSGDTAAVTLEFSEPIQPRFSDFVYHYLGDDAEADIGADNRLMRPDPALDNTRRHAAVPLPPAPEPGWYALDWEVLADDGHTTGGTLRFQLVP